MTELTNLDICKRIAEIEGLTCELRESLFGNKILYALTESHGGLKSYNPLKDDALCFKLMVEHEIEFWSLTACDVKEYHARKLGGNKNVNFHSANRAICLAIIEAHNE